MVASDDRDRPVSRGDARALRVLVADDHAVNRKLFKALLEQRGHVVITVDDGVAALESATSSPFDLVLMDVEMPLMDGTEAAERIRRKQSEGLPRVPIVALTAHTDGHERFLQSGMDAVLVKPVRPADLDAMLGKLFPSSVAAAPMPFDRAAALERFDGQESLFREVVELICEDCPATLEELRKAMSGGDPTRIAFVAHRLAGTLASVSADPARAAARHLEATIKTDPAAAPQAMQVVEARVAEVLAALRDTELKR